jgi:tetratricopeptide (TPR) repeat protein
LEAAAKGALNLALDPELGDQAEAVRISQEAIELGVQSGTPGGLETATAASLNLGNHYYASRELDAARERYQEATDLGKQSGTSRCLEMAAAAAFSLARAVEKTSDATQEQQVYQQAVGKLLS